MLPRNELVALLSAATAFVCPSVYEPLGIVNLEAMACGAAVVGTATGGIPEVVVDGVTGRLVPIEQVHDGTGTPVDPDRVRRRPGRALTEVVERPGARAASWAWRAARRAEDHFAWDADRATGRWRSTSRCSALSLADGRQPASSITARFVAPESARSATVCSDRSPTSRCPEE